MQENINCSLALVVLAVLNAQRRTCAAAALSIDEHVAVHNVSYKQLRSKL